MGNGSTAWLGGVVGIMVAVAGFVALPGAAPPAPAQTDYDAWLAAQRPDGPAVVAVRVGEPAAPAGETDSGPAVAARTLAIGANAHGMLGGDLEAALLRAVAGGGEGSMARVTGTDREVVQRLLGEPIDIVLIGGSLSARELRAGLQQTFAGVELFGLAVTCDFPLQSLSREQLRQILTGEITRWQQIEVDRGPIVVLAPAAEALAERAATALPYGQRLAPAALRSDDPREVADQIRRYPGAIAIVRAGRTPPDGTRLLQIGGVTATPGAFRAGAYPYGIPLHVVTSGAPRGLASAFLDFVTSAAGRELLSHTAIQR